MGDEINLFTERMHKLYLNFEMLEELKRNLECILEIADMHSLDFAKRTLFNEEIKTNNLIEGYNDDIEFIDAVVKNNQRRKNASDIKSQRILNLYNGYKYILNKEEINVDSLSILYQILSRNLLCKYDIENMGKHFRTKPVYIFTSDNINKEPEKGMDEQKVPEFMEKLIEFINMNHDLKTQTDYYIKSQIIHFYFVYIHPYFDVNGRTSRTLSMWYLLNQEVYPYIIFNRGINFDKSTYYKVIMDTKKFRNLTIFIKYMLKTVKWELEKEFALLEIESNIGNLSNLERQSINYILSMKGNKTLKDFAYFYKRFNEKRKCDDIEENIIGPLIQKGIILPRAKTQTYLQQDKKNYFFELNQELVEDYLSLKRNLRQSGKN